LRAGRAFVSNGPLLRCRANGELSGHVFRSARPIQVALEGRLDSRDRAAAVEVVHDGRVEPVTLPCQLTIRESGWFLVRAVAAVTNTFRFASTGPWYAEIGPHPRTIRRESAQFFLDWTRERMSSLKVDEPRQREEALEPLRQAEKFWQDKVAQASRTSP
jgi:hypothetical protein